MLQSDKAIITCAVTGVLTDPSRFPVPVTAAEMAASAKEAYDAGATIMHLHFRDRRVQRWQLELSQDPKRWLMGLASAGF
jgi:uncharacterized protein (DUF849 family)